MTTPALGLAAKQDLLDAVQRAAADQDIRAVVLTGAGRVFIAYQDLGEHAAALAESGAGAFDTIEAHYNPVITGLATMPKPVIAAINGTCAGASSAWPWPATCGSPPPGSGSPPRSPASA